MRQEAALIEIMKLQFVLVELNLFLDTHPDNRQALEDYKNTSRRLKEMIEEYEMRHGPLFPMSPHAVNGTWRWIRDPWPWEMRF